MQQTHNINIEKLMQAQFDAAKFWQLASTFCNFIVMVLSILVIFTDKWHTFLLISTLLVTLLGILFLWHSIGLRAVAEDILRKLEMYNGFGWEITSKEILDLRASSSKSVKKAAYSSDSYKYFASTETVGAERALQNLEESAWWTKHQSRKMAFYSSGAGAFLLLLVIIGLVSITQNPLPKDKMQKIGEVAVVIILFIGATGYMRRALEYRTFSLQAAEADSTANDILGTDTVSEIDAIKLLHDYQVNRAISPLLPSWLWALEKKNLNKLWAEHKTSLK